MLKLSTTNENYESNLQDLESRIAYIEKFLDLSPRKKPVEPTSSLEKKLPPDATFSEPEKEKSQSRPGNWLGIIGIICFVFAAGFIIKLSIDTGWLTHARQIGLAVLLGISLIISGFLLLKSDRGYAALLPATGIIIIYLATLAAYQYYSLISFGAAIAIMSTAAIFCIYFYIIIKHDLYAIIAALFAYLAPVVLQFTGTDSFALYYFLICSLGFAVMSIWIQSRIFIILAAYLSILVTGLVGFNLNNNLLIAMLLPLHFLIFSIATYLYTQHTNKELTTREAWSFFPVLMIFYSFEYYYLSNLYPALAPWMSLSFALILIIIYWTAKRLLPEKTLNSHPVIIAFTTLVLFHSVYIELLPAMLQPWLFVIFVSLIALIPNKVNSKIDFTLYKIPLLAIGAILIIEYIKMMFNLITAEKLSWIIVSFASIASIWLLIIFKKADITKKNYYYLILGSAHLLAITAFYQLTSNHGSLAVSASWLLYGISVVIFAFVNKDKIMAQSALFVLGFAAGKALLYDVSSAPTIIRIFCLLLTGIVLYSSGFIFRKIAAWEK